MTRAVPECSGAARLFPAASPPTAWSVGTGVWREDPYVRMDSMSHGGEIFGLGGDAATEPSFETALRGYEKKQVERYVARAENEIAALAGEREQAYAEVHDFGLLVGGRGYPAVMGTVRANERCTMTSRSAMGRSASEPAAISAPQSGRPPGAVM